MMTDGGPRSKLPGALAASGRVGHLFPAPTPSQGQRRQAAPNSRICPQTFWGRKGRPPWAILLAGPGTRSPCDQCQAPRDALAGTGEPWGGEGGIHRATLSQLLGKRKPHGWLRPQGTDSPVPPEAGKCNVPCASDLLPSLTPAGSGRVRGDWHPQAL